MKKIEGSVFAVIAAKTLSHKWTLLGKGKLDDMHNMSVHDHKFHYVVRAEAADKIVGNLATQDQFKYYGPNGRPHDAQLVKN